MEGLLGWAKEHPTEFYTMLYKLMLGQQTEKPEVAGLSDEARSSANCYTDTRRPVRRLPVMNLFEEEDT